MTSRWLAVLLCAPMLGCLDEDDIVKDLVEQYCQTRWQNCGCESPGVTEIQCVSMLEREGKEAQDEAQDAGLTFDKDCAKSKLVNGAEYVIEGSVNNAFDGKYTVSAVQPSANPPTFEITGGAHTAYLKVSGSTLAFYSDAPSGKGNAPSRIASSSSTTLTFSPMSTSVSPNWSVSDT